MRLNNKLQKVDYLIILGCSDINVANLAVNLYKKGYAQKIIFTGGLGKITKNIC